jgi:hypothetical protein
MPLDQVELIRTSMRGSRVRVALTDAHLAFGRAREAFLAERLTEASTEMSAASSSFARAGSPYRLWAPIFRAIALWIEGSGESAIRELSLVHLERLSATYYHLRGRVAWTKAVALQVLARYDLARPLFAEAREVFRRAGEIEYESVNASYLASVDWFLGNRESKWSNELDALRHVDALPPSSRRTAILESATILALGDNLPETALMFQEQLFRRLSIDGGSTDLPPTPAAYLRRVRPSAIWERRMRHWRISRGQNPRRPRCLKRACAIGPSPRFKPRALTRWHEPIQPRQSARQARRWSSIDASEGRFVSPSCCSPAPERTRRTTPWRKQLVTTTRRSRRSKTT